MFCSIFYFIFLFYILFSVHEQMHVHIRGQSEVLFFKSFPFAHLPIFSPHAIYLSIIYLFLRCEFPLSLDLTNLARLANQSPGSTCLSPSAELGLEKHTNTSMPSFLEMELKSSSLHSKHFTKGALSAALILRLMLCFPDGNKA